MKINFLHNLRKKIWNKDKIQIVSEEYQTTLHWFILLTSFITILVIILGGVFFVYVSYVSSESRGNTNINKNYTTISIGDLQTVISVFNEKEKMFNNILENPPKIVDPSL